MVKQHAWPLEYIGNIFDFKNGLNKGKEFFGKGTPIINYVDVYSQKGLHAEQIKGKVTLSPKEIERFSAQKGDVFFTRTSETPDEVGYAAVLLDEISKCTFSGFVLRARPKNESLLPEYCQYCFQTEAIRNAIILGCTYTTRALTNGRQLSKILIPVPTHSEQKAIAEALSDIDLLIVATEKSLAKKKAIKQGLMQELLTGKRRMRGFNSEKTKTSDFGRIPVDWKIYKIRDIFRFFSNNTLPRTYMNDDAGKIKNIHYGDILTRYDYLLDCKKTVIPYFNDDVQIEYFVESGDIIFADTAEDDALGKAIEVVNAADQQITSGLHTIWARPKANLFAKGFLGFFLNSFTFHAKLLPFVTGTKVSSISKTAIKELLVLCPPIKEQQAIVDLLQNIACSISSESVKLNKYQRIKQGMMSDLLTGRIRLKQEK